jgi:hypothetical protein
MRRSSIFVVLIWVSLGCTQRLTIIADTDAQRDLATVDAGVPPDAGDAVEPTASPIGLSPCLAIPDPWEPHYHPTVPEELLPGVCHFVSGTNLNKISGETCQTKLLVRAGKVSELTTYDCSSASASANTDLAEFDSVGRWIRYERTRPALGMHDQFQREFDSEGNLIGYRTNSPSGHWVDMSQSFDTYGNLQFRSVTDSSGTKSSTLYTYDQAGRLALTLQDLSTEHGASAHRLQWNYDTWGRPLAVERFRDGELIAEIRWVWQSGENQRVSRTTTLYDGMARNSLAPKLDHLGTLTWESLVGAYMADEPEDGLVEGSTTQAGDLCRPLVVTISEGYSEDAYAIGLGGNREPYPDLVQTYVPFPSPAHRAYGYSDEPYPLATPSAFMHFFHQTSLADAAIQGTETTVTFDELGRAVEERCIIKSSSGESPSDVYTRTREYAADRLSVDEVTVAPASLPGLVRDSGTRRMTFEYNTAGQLTKRSVFDGSGNLLAYQETSYGEGNEIDIEQRIYANERFNGYIGADPSIVPDAVGVVRWGLSNTAGAGHFESAKRVNGAFEWDSRTLFHPNGGVSGFQRDFDSDDPWRESFQFDAAGRLTFDAEVHVGGISFLHKNVYTHNVQGYLVDADYTRFTPEQVVLGGGIQTSSWLCQ